MAVGEGTGAAAVPARGPGSGRGSVVRAAVVAGFCHLGVVLATFAATGGTLWILTGPDDPDVEEWGRGTAVTLLLMLGSPLLYLVALALWLLVVRWLAHRLDVRRPALGRAAITQLGLLLALTVVGIGPAPLVLDAWSGSVWFFVLLGTVSLVIPLIVTPGVAAYSALTRPKPPTPTPATHEARTE